MTEPQTPSLPDRQRSPRHPSFGLEEAIARARRIYDEAGRSPVPQAAVADLWGVSEKSSGFRQAIATLKQFTLLDALSVGGVPNVRLTDLARRVFLYTAPEHAAELAATLVEAARAPEMHAKLLEHYPDGLPQSDATLRVQLIRQFQFHDDSVDGFIKELRATLAFAGVTGGGRLGASAAPPKPEEPPMTATANPPAPGVTVRPEPAKVALGTAGPTTTVTLAISRGKWATLTAPESMTASEWKNLIRSLDAQQVGFLIEDDETA